MAARHAPADPAPAVSRPRVTSRRASATRRRTAARRTPVLTGRADPAAITTMPRALRYLEQLSNTERLRIVRYDDETFDLDRMRRLMTALGNPQDRLRVVHLAGTKGKGSTALMLDAMLRANGYKAGLYTSPHLDDVRERLCVGGQMVSQAEFVRLVSAVAAAAGSVAEETGRPPSHFDVLTAMAFKHFADENVDLAIVETGLGGRLDSTNVVARPEVVAFTHISMDHTAQLGRTLAKIAGEKAGIMKPGCVAVSVEQDPDAEAALRQKAGEVGANLRVLGKEIEFSIRFQGQAALGRRHVPQPHLPTVRRSLVCLHTEHTQLEHFAVPVLGEHQATNAGLALAVADVLKGRGFAVSDAVSRRALEELQLPARMELVSRAPKVVADGAHNGASIDALLRGVGQVASYDALVLIFGCCADKDIDAMLGKIACGADKVIFAGIDSARGADPADLAARYGERFGKMAQHADNFDAAYAIARRSATKDDLICVTGSFYLAAEARRRFRAMAKAG